MATTTQINVRTRVRGLWRVHLATAVCRIVRPLTVALWLLERILSRPIGVDIKVAEQPWDRTNKIQIGVSDAR